MRSINARASGKFRIGDIADHSQPMAIECSNGTQHGATP